MQLSSRSRWMAVLALVRAVSIAPNAGAAPEPETVRIARWHAVGPFETGSREAMVHPLADWWGNVPARPDLAASVPSVLVTGGRATWRAVLAERGEDGELTDSVKLEFEDVDFDAREKEWGPAGVANVALAWGEFDLARPGTFLLDASRCSVTIDGLTHAGDPYRADVSRTALVLGAGRHGVLVSASGWGASRAFAFSLERVDPGGPAVRIQASDILLPDAVEGRAGQGFAGVPLVSTSVEWLSDVVVELSGALTGRAVLELPLAPLATLKVPVAVSWPALPRPESDDEAKVPVSVRVTWGSASDEATQDVRVRRPDQPRLETFLSRLDDSAQAYGLRERSAGTAPVGAQGAPGLILTTHGAGVGSAGQAGAYSAKDWAHVVAPSNRRPFGFDWHDWGRLDFEEVMDIALDRFEPDPDRLIITGHSMGGHGAWMMAVHHADRFAACSPSAGWMGHDTYVPPTLRRSQLFADPFVAATWFRGTLPDRVTPFLENLGHLPVRALHGGADDNVPVTHARLMVGALQRQGLDATLVEQEGMGHWWDIDKERPGADCVDAAWMEDAWRSSRRVHDPLHVTFVSADPDVSARLHWVELVEPERVATEARIEAEVVSRSAVRVSTRGVTRCVLHLSAALVDAGPLSVEWGGRSYRVTRPDADLPIVLERGARRASVRLARPADLTAREHGPVPGGFRKALFQPFLFVAGTTAGQERSEGLLQVARSLALAWWVRGNGHAPIVRDVDLTDELRARYSLVLLGGPAANAESARVARGLDVRAAEGGVTVGGRVVRGAGLASVHWQVDPRDATQRLLVFQGTDARGEALLGLANPFSSGLGYPDWMVFGSAVRARGLGGASALGWWQPGFGFAPGDSWFAED